MEKFDGISVTEDLTPEDSAITIKRSIITQLFSHEQFNASPPSQHLGWDNTHKGI